MFNKKKLSKHSPNVGSTQHTCHESSQNWAQVSISEANISAVHRRTRSLQKQNDLCFGWFFRDLVIWREKTGKIHPDFWLFCWFLQKKILQKETQPFSSSTLSWVVETQRGCLMAPYPFGTFSRVQVSFYTVFYTPSVYRHWTSPTFGRNKILSGWPRLILCAIKKNESTKLFHQNFNMELWTYDDFSPKNQILFPTSLKYFRTKMQHTFFKQSRSLRRKKYKFKS